MVSITVQPRGGKPSKKFPVTVQVNSLDSTVAELKQAIALKSKVDVHRQRLTTSDKKVLEDGDHSLKQSGLKDGDSLEIKDLGPQICKQNPRDSQARLTIVFHHTQLGALS